MHAPSPLDAVVERYFVETGKEQIWHEAYISREALIRDILSGQFDRSPISIIWHASTDEGLRDVTKEIAEQVLNEAEPDLDADNVPTFGCLTEFLESNCGVETVAEVAHGSAA